MPSSQSVIQCTCTYIQYLVHLLYCFTIDTRDFTIFSVLESIGVLVEWIIENVPIEQINIKCIDNKPVGCNQNYSEL